MVGQIAFLGGTFWFLRGLRFQLSGLFLGGRCLLNLLSRRHFLLDRQTVHLFDEFAGLVAEAFGVLDGLFQFSLRHRVKLFRRGVLGDFAAKLVGLVGLPFDILRQVAGIAPDFAGSAPGLQPFDEFFECLLHSALPLGDLVQRGLPCLGVGFAFGFGEIPGQWLEFSFGKTIEFLGGFVESFGGQRIGNLVFLQLLAKFVDGRPDAFLALFDLVADLILCLFGFGELIHLGGFHLRRFGGLFHLCFGFLLQLSQPSQLIAHFALGLLDDCFHVLLGDDGDSQFRAAAGFFEARDIVEIIGDRMQCQHVLPLATAGRLRCEHWQEPALVRPPVVESLPSRMREWAS